MSHSSQVIIFSSNGCLLYPVSRFRIEHTLSEVLQSFPDSSYSLDLSNKVSVTQGGSMGAHLGIYVATDKLLAA